MTHNVCFPTRIYNNLGSATDKIFINNTRFNSFTVSSTVNGLSDHDAQYFKNVFTQKMVTCLTYRTRGGSEDSISNFQEPLKFETWDNIYKHDDINIIFNSILNTNLFFNLVFPFTIQP